MQAEERNRGGDLGNSARELVVEAGGWVGGTGELPPCISVCPRQDSMEPERLGSSSPKTGRSGRLLKGALGASIGLSLALLLALILGEYLRGLGGWRG